SAVGGRGSSSGSSRSKEEPTHEAPCSSDARAPRPCLRCRRHERDCGRWPAPLPVSRRARERELDLGSGEGGSREPPGPAGDARPESGPVVHDRRHDGDPRLAQGHPDRRLDHRPEAERLARRQRARSDRLLARPGRVHPGGQPPEPDVRAQLVSDTFKVCDTFRNAANASNSPRAAAMPRGTYSATSRSFGEWIWESGRPKPVITVAIPFPDSAATIGSVPPLRTSTGRLPSARSNAS